MRPKDLATQAVHGAGSPDPTTGSLLPPIYQSTTYARARLGEEPAFSYSRAANPTVSALERALGEIEDAPYALAFSSGMAATTTLCLAVLHAGDRVVAGNAVYGGSYRLLRQTLAPLGISADFVDSSREDAVAAALEQPARLLVIETPANPTLRLTDIAAISALGQRAGALVVVDNTFLTPVLQRPLDLGADLVLYSTTKYLDGHNATLGGALVTRDSALRERLDATRRAIGTIQSPFEAWLTLQGLKTLSLRVPRQSASAWTVARYLDQHPAVARVLYPWLASFPQHELARQQQGAGGGIVSFALGGEMPLARTFASSLRLCHLAENLGAAQSLLTHPASMTHAAMPAEHRAVIGLGEDLLRLSIGLERAEDIVEDLDQALAAAGVAP